MTARKSKRGAGRQLPDPDPSVRNGHFSRLPAAAVVDRRVSNAELRILALIGTYADRYGQCWPAMGTMARRLGVSRQALLRPIRKLQEVGYLRVTRHYHRNGAHRSHVYSIIYPAVPDAPTGRPPGQSPSIVFDPVEYERDGSDDWPPPPASTRPA